jgi:hypothetical protein
MCGGCCAAKALPPRLGLGNSLPSPRPRAAREAFDRKVRQSAKSARIPARCNEAEPAFATDGRAATVCGQKKRPEPGRLSVNEKNRNRPSLAGALGAVCALFAGDDQMADPHPNARECGGDEQMNQFLGHRLRFLISCRARFAREPSVTRNTCGIRPRPTRHAGYSFGTTQGASPAVLPHTLQRKNPANEAEPAKDSRCAESTQSQRRARPSRV